jgi:hypothetical protein
MKNFEKKISRRSCASLSRWHWGTPWKSARSDRLKMPFLAMFRFRRYSVVFGNSPSWHIAAFLVYMYKNWSICTKNV